MNLNAHNAYLFGYQSAVVFEAGSYTYDFDPDTFASDCLDPSVLVSAFTTPQAALEIDLLSQGAHAHAHVGSTTNPSADNHAMGI